MENYGISITTLEEVFLKIGHLEDPMSILDPETVINKEALVDEEM